MLDSPPRGRFARLFAGLAGIVLLATCECEDPFFYEPISVTVAVLAVGGGSGNVRAVDQSVIDLDCDIILGVRRSGCSAAFVDAGGGGVFDLLATADSGSAFVEWEPCSVEKGSASCDGCSGSERCRLSFDPETDVKFTVWARFELEADIVFSDNFSSGKAWTAEVTVTTGGATHTIETPAAGGNPGGYRHMTHDFPAAGQIGVFHRLDDAVYDPADGPILSIDYSEFRIQFDPPFSTASIGAAFAVRQGGVLYSISNSFQAQEWSLWAANGLTPQDFVPAPGPNFNGGGPLEFGYIRSNSTGSATGHTTTHGIDNWRVAIHR